MKKHILSMIVYLLGFLALFALFMILEQPFLLAFLLIYFLLPCICLPLYFRGIKAVHFRAFCPVAHIEINQQIPVYFEFMNPSFSPFFLTGIQFLVNNLYYPNEYVHTLDIHVMPRKTERITIPIDTSCVGIVKVNVEKVTVTDPLHFFTYTIPDTAVLEIPILPESTDQRDLPSTPASDGLDEYTESESKGSVSSDVKEIREYRPGDRLQRIHWKLSAKLDDLFVKEMAHTSVLSLVLLPELTKEHIEDTVSVLLGCIKTLNDREERFEVCLFNSKAVDFTFLQAFDEASRIEAVIRLYYLPLYEDPNAAKDAFFASGIKKATVIQIIGEEIHILPAE